MKGLLIVVATVIIIAFIVTPVMASKNFKPDWLPFEFNSDWDQEDSTVQKVVMLLIVADWVQTRQIASNPDRYQEMNPILGPHPDRDEVDRYFAYSIIGNTLIAYLLPKKLRQRWQASSLSMQMRVVGHNYKMGISFGL